MIEARGRTLIEPYATRDIEEGRQVSAGSSQNLKLLRAFCEVARHLSFSRAALELNRSQSTLSVQVRELERQLNVSLLQRTTRRVALTEAGDQLARALNVGFSAIDEGVASVRESGDARRGKIMLACVPSISGTLLPAMLAQYRARDSKSRIEVAELTSREIFVALDDGSIDFGIGPCTDPPPPNVSFTPAIDDPLFVIMPAEDELAVARGVPFEQLMRRPLITLSGSVLLQQMLQEVATLHDLTLSSQTEVRHVQTAIAMAQARVGAAIVPRLALPSRIGEGVVALPIIEPSLNRRVGLLTAAGRPLTGATARLARYIRSALPKSAGQHEVATGKPQT